MSSFFLKLQGCDGCDQTKDNPWDICDNDRKIALFFEEAVVNPKATVDGCDKRLEEVSLVISEVVHDLWEVRHIHHDTHDRCNPTENFRLFFTHFQSTRFLMFV